MVSTNSKNKLFQSSLLLSSILTLGLLPGSAALAQDNDAGAGYRVEENAQNAGDKAGKEILLQSPNSVPAVDQKTQGPVRLARFASIKGNVVWRADDTADWVPATVNMPLRQGAQIWVTESGRAEVQFDDGSALRLGNNALVTMKLFYSDADGEFTQITMNEGLATLHSRRDVSVYQVDTPLLSVKTKGEAQVRFGIGGGSEIAVQRGDATIEGQQGKLTLHQNEYLDVADANAAYAVRRLPEADSWDRWNTDRNRYIDGVSKTSKHVPANVGIVAGELDDYGDWREDPKYGSVWVPRNTEEGWRPYYHGRWTWVDPFGWTWVGEEAWGWAPYHYGTWVNQPYGWAWCPGPVAQYWSPGVVGFSVYAGSVAWAPLCPWEVRYPSVFSVGIFGGNWGLNFSIGSCGVYYPGGYGYCVGRPFDNYYINRFGYGYGGYGERFGHQGNVGNGFNNYNHNTLAAGNHFVPYNSSHGAGSTVATAEAFGGRGKYQLVGKADTSYFARGQSIAPAAGGRAPVSGPSSVQPTRLSTTPTRSFATNVHVPQTSAQHSVYQASLPSNVQHSLPAYAPTHTANAANNTMTRPVQSTVATARQSGISTPRVNTGQATNSSTANDTRITSTTPRASSPNFSRPADNHGGSAAEAAWQARASLGMTGREQGVGQSSGSVGHNGGNSGSSSYSNAAHSGGNAGSYSGAGSNSGQRYSTSGSSGRSYSGGEYQIGNSGAHSAPSSGSSGGYRGGSSGSYSSGGSSRNYGNGSAGSPGSYRGGYSGGITGGYRAGESGGYRGGGSIGSSHSSGGSSGSSSHASSGGGSGHTSGGGSNSGGSGGHSR